MSDSARPDPDEWDTLPADGRVPLKVAWVWTCPGCGRDNLAASRYYTRAQIMAAALQLGVDFERKPKDAIFAAMDQPFAPARVACECGRKWLTDPPIGIRWRDPGEPTGPAR